MKKFKKTLLFILIGIFLFAPLIVLTFQIIANSEKKKSHTAISLTEPTKNY